MIAVTSLILAVAVDTVTANPTHGATARPSVTRTVSATSRLRNTPSHCATRRRPSHRPARIPIHDTNANVADTFLRKQAFTVSDLSTQIHTDARARAAYAQYFTLIPAETLQRMQAQPSTDQRFLSLLTSAPLPVTGVYTEYRCHSNGVVYPVKVTLPRGVRVFRTSDRAFQLLAGSGDPIVPYTTVTNVITVPAPPQAPLPPVEIVTPAAPTEIIQQAPGSAPAPTSPTPSEPAPTR